jgi:Peptidase family C25/CARDB
MKSVVHVAGADDTNLSRYLTNSLNSWGAIIKDSSFGATITTLSKTSGSSVNTTQNDIAKLFENGIALLTYYGHSAATGLAYNLNNPNDYNNTGKYPIFLVNGCSAGNFFDYDTVRFNIKNSLAEKFVFAKSKGSIAFIATSHFGITSYLDPYSTGFYTSVSKTNYGSTIGENMMGALAQLKISSNNFTDYHGSNHGQQFILHGDPAIKIYTSTKPDFVIEDAQVAINPTFISVLNNSFTFKANIYNIGKATGDSVRVLVTRKYPNGADSIVINKKIESIKYQDSIAITIPVNPITDKGNNSITIIIDNDNKYDELSETNNTITKQFVIFEDALNPIYPYNYSIIHQQNIKLSASTANAFAPLGQYIMELDTTTLFNSSFKITKTISSVGGLLQFDPAITFKDSTVYYWRVAAVPNNGVYHWGNSSFVFLQNATQDGFNQSHFYQHCENELNNLVTDTASRTFLLPIINNTLTIRNSVYPYNLDYSIAINDAANPRTKGIAWRGQNLTFTVYNPSTLNEMYNVPANAPIGLYGSLGSPGGTLGREYDFAFNTTTIAGRKAAMDFMDNIIANGSYVVVRSIILDDPYWPTPTYAIDWKSDDTLYGTGNSLYHRLKNAGFNDIDLFDKKRAFAFVYQKNNIAFTPVSTFSKDSSDIAILKVVVPTKPNEGYVISPKFGPATKWYNMLWTGIRNDLEDMVTIKLLGIKNNNVVDTLQIFTELQTNNNIANIDAATYPYLKIMMQVKDTTYLTAYQLKYWRLLADVLPEGGLLPINFVFKDTLQKGEPQNISIAFKNISNTAYSDSLNVKFNITDNNNVTHSLNIAKLKKLLPGDIDTIKTTINTQDFAGTNNFYISVNPLNTPQEQTLTNNFVYKKFFVINDNINPVLDVTFDGTHILNGDIVSSKPNIHINLKDESTFMLLNDTSIMNVKLQYHDDVNGTIITMNYKYDNDILKFIPAVANGKNTATVEFNPILLNDGTYELFVTAKDKSENATGTQQYRILFRVNNKPMISNVFNYPNPFTTSTAFVFTLTGSQIPDNLRIQILTVTGKIVKEITKNELGYLHIGNNITDYKWDGTDMYGQALGNGVYLYRIITSLNGKALDKFNASNFNSDAVNTDNYFKAGYGKMYLMR